MSADQKAGDTRRLSPPAAYEVSFLLNSICYLTDLGQWTVENVIIAIKGLIINMFTIAVDITPWET